MSMATSKTKVNVDNISFYTELSGPSDGPLVLLSHALMASHHLWDYTVASLNQAGYRTLRYDHIGHNLTSGIPSSEGEASYHLDDFVRHLHQLVQTLCPERIDTIHAIIGCSIGGLIAIRYPMLYPATVRKVLACGPPRLVPSVVSKSKWADRIATFRDPKQGLDVLAHRTVTRWFPDPCPEGVRDAALRQTLTVTLEGYTACATAITSYDYSGADPKVQSFNRRWTSTQEQILILLGENDEAVGNIAEAKQEFETTLRGNHGDDGQNKRNDNASPVLMEVEVVKDAGHVVPMHRAAWFEDRMLTFLR